MNPFTSLNYRKYLALSNKLNQKPLVKVSLYLALTMFIVSFLGLFAIRPTLVTIIRLSKELKEKRIVNESLERKIKDLETAQVSLAAVNSSIPNIEAALPKNPQFNSTAQKINYLAYKNKLSLVNAGFGSFIVGETATSSASLAEANMITVQLTLAGNYLDLKNFLSEFTNLDRVCELNSVVFSTKTNLSQAKVQMDLAGKFYYLP